MKMSRLELKQMLEVIKSSKFKVPQDIDAFDTAMLMMDYLGDIEGEFRDDLIYSILGEWIMEGVFGKEQLIQLLKKGLDDKHLFYKIGDQNSESVFMRAFSVLVIALIIYKHRQDSFLSEQELIEVKNTIIKYMSEEKDVRGYVAEGGWAHTTAHTADALDELALCGELGRNELLEILNAIKNKVSIDYHAYICYEDERLAYAVNSLISRALLTEEEISEWIISFQEYKEKKSIPNHFYLITNIRNFLNSLYYRLPKDDYKVIKKTISDTIMAIRRF